MWNELKRQLRPSLVALALLTVLTGLVYPLLVTGLAQMLMTNQANGSLIVRDGKTVGSEWIGQPFTSAKYFWSRPSATSPDPDNAASSSGSNLGPTNPALIAAVKDRITSLTQAQGAPARDVPVDLVTASASGLDPDISPAAALFQISRVARARGMTEDAVRRLVLEHVQGRTFGLLGEPRVNVLELNLALDATNHKN